MIPPRIEKVEILEDYMIQLIYDNGERKVYDMKPNLEKKPFRKLRDYNLFKNVKAAGETIEWETGEDISPEDLYINSKPI